MKLAIDETRCKGCNLCTKVCPYRIFREGTRPNLRGIVVPELDRPERCTNCRLRHLYGQAALRRLPAHLSRPGHPLG